MDSSVCVIACMWKNREGHGAQIWTLTGQFSARVLFSIHTWLQHFKHTVSPLSHFSFPTGSKVIWKKKFWLDKLFLIWSKWKMRGMSAGMLASLCLFLFPLMSLWSFFPQHLSHISVSLCFSYLLCLSLTASSFHSSCLLSTDRLQSPNFSSKQFLFLPHKHTSPSQLCGSGGLSPPTYLPQSLLYLSSSPPTISQPLQGPTLQAKSIIYSRTLQICKTHSHGCLNAHTYTHTPHGLTALPALLSVSY